MRCYSGDSLYRGFDPYILLAGLKNIVRYTGDFVIKGFVISEFHCMGVLRYINSARPRSQGLSSSCQKPKAGRRETRGTRLACSLFPSRNQGPGQGFWTRRDPVSPTPFPIHTAIFATSQRSEGDCKQSRRSSNTLPELKSIRDLI